jgi:hypothetical protein
MGKSKCRNVCVACNTKISAMTVKTFGFTRCKLVITGMKVENGE